ncbi:hypothetical protein G4Z05_15575 [Bacillus thermocopriae]|uniref:Uncharacterized protein n=1 Tax=Neobacillus thermocopriae TaxID=1215031 RepID=A0A6B3TUM2_9BACI|nr:heparinase II/III family protein [Neobacillus thermocopriae]NEX80250.1 hypothetical protein [Neobacillus thermocopriae]
MRLFKRTLPNQSSLQSADLILDNKIFLFKIWEPYSFKGNLSWTEDPYKDKTWKFYLHCLRMVSFLTNGYEMTKDLKYLKKAVWFITSWMEFNPTPEKNVSEWAWSGHGTANRLLNLIYFWSEYKNSPIYNEDFGQKFMDLLETHGHFLADQKNYEDYNHGIFQDQALLELTVFFKHFKNCNEWQEIAISRLLARFNKDVSNSGVHREHSPAYHVVVHNLFIVIKDFMDYHKIQYPADFSQKLYLMQDFLAYMTKSNGYLPLVGDTGLSSAFNSIEEGHILNEHWAYRSSKGKQGTLPEKIFFAYLDSGVALFRTDLNKHFKNKIFWYFSCAFNSIIHKHADDLSFELQYKNTDFIVDSGKYNYKEKDEFRKYFRSVFAHNTIAVDGKTYPLNKEQIGKSLLFDSYEQSESYYVVQGCHELYSGIRIYRTMIQLRDQALIIHDRIVSDKHHQYTQIFNIGKDVSVIKRDNDNFLLVSKKEDATISLRQMYHISSVSILKGQENPIYAWQSYDFNQKHPITSLHFTKDGQSIEFLTILAMDDSIHIDTVKIHEANNFYHFRFIDIYGNNLFTDIKVRKYSEEELFRQKIRQYGKSKEAKDAWELFSNRNGYKLVRCNMNLNKRQIKNQFFVELNGVLVKTIYANDIDSANQADFYSNGYVYISIANEDGNWSNDERPTKEQLNQYFERNKLILYYLDES